MLRTADTSLASAACLFWQHGCFGSTDVTIDPIKE
jgi:hypothetical protein